jgi:ABC-type transport system involved in cytochrome bd biosynthesis fused ATPase/permease subunit
MNSSELNEDAVTKLNTSSQNDMNKQSEVLKETNITIQQNSAIKMTHASFGWSTDDKKICLENISLAIPKKSLVAVVGQVGSGKSSLLSAILGEMEPMLLEGNLNIDTDVSKIDNGSIIVDGTIAYAAQQAWIQNATLKNNILFR